MVRVDYEAGVTRETMKPHYQCTKAECLQALAQHGCKPHKDLTVVELRVLLREARRTAGILPVAKVQTIMDTIKKSNRGDLCQMCTERGIPFTSKASVGELRLSLRHWVTNSGTAETVLEIGKHAGSTFQELMAVQPGYIEWAVKEVEQSADPDWRLVQLARWAAHHMNAEVNEETPMVPPQACKGMAASMTRTTANKGYKNPPLISLRDVTSTGSASSQSDMANNIKEMKAKIQELEAQVKTQQEEMEEKEKQHPRKTRSVPAELMEN